MKIVYLGFILGGVEKKYYVFVGKEQDVTKFMTTTKTQSVTLSVCY